MLGCWFCLVLKKMMMKKAKRLCEKVLGYRIFSDEQGKMNLNVQQAGGSLWSFQFTF